MKKRIFTYLSLIVTLCLFLPPPVSAQNYWSGASTQDWTGDGTESNPYLITTAEQLAGLAKAVQDGRDFKGEFIRLGPMAERPIGSSRGKAAMDSYRRHYV